jgi:hypothetical protein
MLVKPIAQVLGLSTPAPPSGSETVGLDAEFGITSSSEQSLVFTKNVLSGVYVGQVGMAGVYIKPNLGTTKAMMLYDEANPEAEGEIWITPIIKVRVFDGTPEGYSLKTTMKLVVDGQVIDSKTLERSGAGSPPQSIRMDKVLIKGRDLHAILKMPKGQLPSVRKGALRRVAYLSACNQYSNRQPRLSRAIKSVFIRIMRAWYSLRIPSRAMRRRSIANWITRISGASTSR